MPPLKDPRRTAIEAVEAEYGAEIRAAKFAYDARVRAAINKRSESLQNLVRRLEPLPRQEQEAKVNG